MLDRVDQGSQDVGGGLPLPGRPAGDQAAEPGRQVCLEAVDDVLAVGAELEHGDAAVACVGGPAGQAAAGHPVEQAADVGSVAAQYFGDLQGATDQYVSNGNFTGWESKIFVTWFRGRAVITPEIPIFINGMLQYVAVGTTVRQILGMFGGGAYPAGSYAGGFTFARAVNNIVDKAISFRQERGTLLQQVLAREVARGFGGRSAR